MIESPLIARLEDLPFSSLHVKARIIVGSATFFDAFNALALAFALPVLIRLWHITPAQTGFLIGISYVGQFIGALLFSLLAEKFGRIRAASAATALMSLMSLACALAHSFTGLMVYRVIQGIDRDANLALLDDLCDTLFNGSLCGLGGLTPYPVQSAVKHFRGDFLKA